MKKRGKKKGGAGGVIFFVGEIILPFVVQSYHPLWLNPLPQFRAPARLAATSAARVARAALYSALAHRSVRPRGSAGRARAGAWPRAAPDARSLRARARQPTTYSLNFRPARRADCRPNKHARRDNGSAATRRPESPRVCRDIRDR